jgi:hypothetical protein
VIRKLSAVELTATAPRIRQMLQLQRRTEAKPWISVVVNFTAPQWQDPLRVIGSEDVVSITPGLSPARP